MDHASRSILTVSALVLVGGAGWEIGTVETSPGAVQQSVTADAFLAKFRGVDPVVCNLVGQALRNQWGRSVATPVLRLPGQSDESVAMARWAHEHHETDVIPRLRAGLEDADPCVRETAARLFDHVRDRDAAARELMQAVRAPRGATRLAAVTGLGYLEDDRSVSTLTQLLSSGDVDMRQSTTWALGRIEHADAIPALVQALRDEDAGVRGNAAWALGRIERSAAVTPLAAVLQDTEVSVRLNAALALGQIEDPAAIPALSELLRQDRSPEVRKAAAWALGKIE